MPIVRINTLQRLLREKEAGALLVTAPSDIRWACGFTGSNALLIVRPERAHFLTDSRYASQAQDEVDGADVYVPGYDLTGYAAEENLVPATGRVLVQAEHVTLATLADLEEKRPEATFAAESRLLAPLVAVKTEDEVDRIRAAQRITEAVFDHVLGLLRPGLTEREVAAEIVYQHLRRGAERMSFEPIVAAGARGALPHARPSDNRLTTGDLIVIDMGGVVEGYASDMTRTVAVGEPGPEARAVYEVVLQAQQRALDAARAGLTSKALDAAARDAIAGAGYSDYFGHSLGHGIGLQTHEWPPVSFRSEAVLPAGVAVTIEPGIYLPGRFGVRIEDIVVLREDGAENLTRAPKHLVVL